jgi:SAM-dependent methyltransferase
VVSVDYVTRPLSLFAEMHRTLRPGGLAIMSFSNRMFWHKAVRIWTEASEWQRASPARSPRRVRGRIHMPWPPTPHRARRVI